MLGLLEFINDRYKEALDAKGDKKKPEERLSALLAVLKTFLGEDRDINILSVLSTRWQNEFRDFLTETYTFGDNKHLTKSSVKEHLNRLKSVAREAVKQGILPNIKIFEDQDTVELKGDKHQHDAQNGITKLFRYLPSNSKERIALDYLMLSLLLCGMPIWKMVLMPKSGFNDGSIILPHMRNIQVPLSQSLKVLASRNASEEESVYAFSYIKDTDNEKQRSTKLKSLITDVRVLSSRLGVPPIFDSPDPIHIWLKAASRSLTNAEIKRIITAYVYPELPIGSDLSNIISKAISSMSEDKGNIVSTWFAVKSLKRSATDLVKILDKGKSDDAVMFDDVYAPQDIKFKKKGSRIIRYNNPAVDRLLFIRCTVNQIRPLQSLLWEEGIFYLESDKESSSTKTAVQIPDSQVENLKNFLKETDETRLYQQEINAVGKKVRVLEGMYKGCEGIIVEYEGDKPKGAVDSATGTDSKKEKITYFAVKLMGSSFFITPSVEATMVEEII